MAAEIVEDDDVAGRERRHEALFDPGGEGQTVDRLVEDTGRVDPVASKRRDEGHGAPVAVRRLADQLLAPGARLVRGWHGRTIEVLATEEGFLFEGRSYRSLTSIAREVTGARWSGPRFFGLTARG